MAIAPDGRVFVCEQGGALRISKNGALPPDPFLTVTVDSAGERGLLGVALDPNFATNQYVYVYYTGAVSGAQPAEPVHGERRRRGLRAAKRSCSSSTTSAPRPITTAARCTSARTEALRRSRRQRATAPTRRA
jgi:hypothetical protein